MPSSRPSTIPYVIHILKQLEPETILDIGVGFGKWGYLFREYTDIRLSEYCPERYNKKGWKVRIEGIEVFKPYIHEAHNYIYDRIHVGSAQEIVSKLGEYDLIFLGDVIEHLTFDEGINLIKASIVHSRKGVIITTPARKTNQGVLCGNPFEEHRSFWSRKDFRRVGQCQIKFADGQTYVIFYPKPDWRHVRICLEYGSPNLLTRMLRNWKGTLKLAFQPRTLFSRLGFIFQDSFIRICNKTERLLKKFV